MPSLVARLARWLAPASEAARAAPVSPAAPPAGCSSYPPLDPGLPCVDACAVIAPHTDWLIRLRYAYGADVASFERDIGSVVERYAHYVHLLPASRGGPFDRPGGLFRMGLEIGFYALQAADGALFSGRQTISERARLEPRWRYATFLAGLCSEAYRALGHLTVSNDHGELWPACRQSLALWLRETGSEHYRPRWRRHGSATRALGLVALPHIVTPAILQDLADGDTLVLAHFMAATSGALLAGEANTLDALVRRAAALVIANDAPRTPPAPGDTSCRRTDASDLVDAAAHRPVDGKVPAVTLIAPARLHPVVREALREIIASLAAPDLPHSARVTESGVFVPLHEFERRGIEPAAAVQALGDMRMLVADAARPQARTCTRRVDAEPVLGILLAPHCVDARAFAAQVGCSTPAP